MLVEEVAVTSLIEGVKKELVPRAEPIALERVWREGSRPWISPSTVATADKVDAPAPPCSRVWISSLRAPAVAMIEPAISAAVKLEL